ncbi:hypothetical protein ACHQM5_016715 [Ranunculus cassubicifolius]
MAATAMTRSIIFSKLQSSQKNSISPKKELSIQKYTPADNNKVSIVLQPRVTNLRSYSSDGSGAVRKRGYVDDDGVSSFFASLAEYVENTRNSEDFEIILGRLAMVIFAATVTAETVTGNSMFRKMDLDEIAKGAGVCLGAVICAAGFAWFSSARTKVGGIFNSNCSTFIDSLIDKLIDGLFYENDLWMDEM